MDRAKIRLYVNAPLGAGQAVGLDRAQAHYLMNVMRKGAGDAVALFNGADGEWHATLAEAGRKGAVAVCNHQQAPQALLPDIWLLFAPVKKARIEFIVEKAVELGVARLVAVLTRYTNAERLREERVAAHIIEAVEQCGTTALPAFEMPQKLETVLRGWDVARRLVFCDERGAAPMLAEILDAPNALPGPWAILIGPEGGFAPEEAEMLRNLPFCTAASLGPRILRADTAALAALAIWQSRLGDW
ncbi:MAG: 16S rRNA (uracil(1498)-N(3))-methyltransferase [Paracoccaceae bacterium]